MQAYIKPFPTDYQAVLERVDSINAINYAKSRNFLDGSVTYLSPYFTHGVISTSDVFERIMERYSLKQAEKLVFELGWRDFYQMAYRWHGEGMFRDIRQAQEGVSSEYLPKTIDYATTDIRVLDEAIEALYETGYMHNHARMWLASLVCNVAQVHWWQPSQWMYYYLLDGDLASNSLSWQWVAGTFSNKKYYANQENLNKYSGYKQHGTVLDVSYAELPELDVPANLRDAADVKVVTPLPKSTISSVEPDKPVLLYHMWMLSPIWQQDMQNAVRVLILEPSLLGRFPMSQKRIDFVLDLAKEINGLEIFVGELSELKGLANASSIQSIEHPAVTHWNSLAKLRREPQPSMFQPVFKEYRSFFAYWKACQRTEKFKEIV